MGSSNGTQILQNWPELTGLGCPFGMLEVIGELMESTCRITFKVATIKEQKVGFIKRVHKCWITTGKDLESWRFER